ncbi:MAG: transposase [Candidatus Hatepunaea meridiana]|nr:transposase [Candidatus Hatepunaea meridiana]
MITQRLKIRQNNLPHWQQGGCVYYITFRSIRERLTESALDRIKDVILHDHNRKYRLYITVIMPDHVHIILQPLEMKTGVWFDLAGILKTIKGVSARRINEVLRTRGTVWQKESYDRIIRNDEELIEKWNYMLRNPEDEGLIKPSEEYKFIIIPPN